MQNDILYGLFRCNECGREELKRVPFYPVGGLIYYECYQNRLDYRWGQELCRGEMVLDTRYNFAGLLSGECAVDNDQQIVFNTTKFQPNGWLGWFNRNGTPFVADVESYAPLFV